MIRNFHRHKSHARAFLGSSLQWHHNERDGVSNHQPHDCLLNRLFRRRSKKTSKLRVTGLCAGNSPGTDEFPAQMASTAENVLFDDVIMFCYVLMPAHSSHQNLPVSRHTNIVQYYKKNQIRILTLTSIPARKHDVTYMWVYHCNDVT